MNVKQVALFVLAVACSFLLGGCLYPEDQRAQNAIPYEDQLQTVQRAVDQFQVEEGGILPIKTKEMDTDPYEKYPVDFAKIAPRFIAEPPATAYESGGVYQYVLTNVETEPAVKLIDLRMAEQIRSIQVRLIGHEYPPFQQELAPNVYTLNYEALGYKEEPYVTSPYSGNNLPLVMTGAGKLHVDYSADLAKAVQDAETPPTPGEDIRYLLESQSPVLPAYSLPYTVDENGNIAFLNE